MKKFMCSTENIIIIASQKVLRVEVHLDINMFYYNVHCYITLCISHNVAAWAFFQAYTSHKQKTSKSSTTGALEFSGYTIFLTISLFMTMHLHINTMCIGTSQDFYMQALTLHVTNSSTQKLQSRSGLWN